MGEGQRMKALTLTQPWASLVAIGAKRIETRSWGTSYRGPLAIHAAKGFPRDARDFSRCIRLGVLFGPHYEYPRGFVIATCRLAACVQVEKLLSENAYRLDMTEQEQLFGNYEPGRWGWMLADIKAINPEPAKGALGLWEWKNG
jgi:hypothetical protein